MGLHTRIYIGPYATWLVPQDAWLASFEWPGKTLPQWRGDKALYEEVFRVFPEAALAIVGIDWGGAVVDGRPFLAFFGLPREARRGTPQRVMLMQTDQYGVFQPSPQPTDWTGLDQEAEVRWFQSAFAAELARATDLFGGPPTYRWGLLLEYLT
jgi:hypothetical protein